MLPSLKAAAINTVTDQMIVYVRGVARADEIITVQSPPQSFFNIFGLTVLVVTSLLCFSSTLPNTEQLTDTANECLKGPSIHTFTHSHILTI